MPSMHELGTVESACDEIEYTPAPAAASAAGATLVASTMRARVIGPIKNKLRASDRSFPLLSSFTQPENISTFALKAEGAWLVLEASCRCQIPVQIPYTKWERVLKKRRPRLWAYYGSSGFKYLGENLLSGHGLALALPCINEAQASDDGRRALPAFLMSSVYPQIMRQHHCPISREIRLAEC
ncbi:hypothetical protein FA95DRAFT_282914 [Auriscalpium vulgare]|uniref:Uncharacterized protein n=1 Tax=Auriscalpium vulgare TaxID=40419 RepID=A0ACB8S4T1_9AGAM|nr:hypothetical protein FA95DRAFT_282914 [Auriscalpium vulgare]